MRHALVPFPRLWLDFRSWEVGVGLATAAIASGGFELVPRNRSGLDYLHAAENAAAVDKAGGCAVDLNGDGWTDLIFGRHGDSVVVFLNNADGTFRDGTAAHGLSSYRDVSAIAAGDLDNDGDDDLVLGPMAGESFQLLINQGSGQFIEEAARRGADLRTAISPHAAQSISMVDFDRDGFLDLYLSEWGVTKDAEQHRHCVLLRNRGATHPGHFENVTVAAGLLQPTGEDQHVGFSSAWVDFDADGWPDLARVSDFGTSQMFWNNADGTFHEATRPAGMGRDEFGIGNAVADIDHDGFFDVLISSIHDRVSLSISEEGGLGQGNKLYRYVGNRRFAESAAIRGAARTGWSWGAAFFELDNDRDDDLFITNGWITTPDRDPLTTPFVDAATDGSAVLENDGTGFFHPVAEAQGVTDNGLGRAVLVLDHDRDGDEDIVITQAFGRPLLYRNDAAANGNHWIRFSLEGTTSNRSAYGSHLRVTANGKDTYHHYNPTNAYMGQREGVIHVGLGAISPAGADVTVTWPSGIVQNFANLAANTEHRLTEATSVTLGAPLFATHPVGGTFEKGATVKLTARATANPAPVYSWFKNGQPLPGEFRSTLILDHVHPADAGTYAVAAINPQGVVSSANAVVHVTIDPAKHSVARWWNEFLLDAIRMDFPDPTIHSRNLYHVSAAMWDAYWAYQPGAWTEVAALFQQEDPTIKTVAAQAEAISHAAYTVLTHRYQRSPGRERSLRGFDWLMQRLGCHAANVGTEGDSPAATGNRIGAAVIAAGLVDGANEANAYADSSDYMARNSPLRVAFPSTVMMQPNHWQPLAFAVAITQNGIPLDEQTQSFLGVNWRAVTPFALAKTSPTSIALDPGPPPQLGSSTDTRFRDAAVEVLRYSARLDPDEGEMIDISPGALLNNDLGTNSGTGRPLNPVIGEAYAPNLVNRADYGRILAEFWADGPNSETPPGHWNTLHNQITDDPQFERRYAGIGPAWERLAWDVNAYLTLNGAMHDVSIAAWAIKRKYDSARPVSMIRHLARQGQSSDPTQPSYHPGGIPLVADLVEVITDATSATGQRHAHLADFAGEIAVRTWAGEPGDIHADSGGVAWIRAANWLPYQKSTFVSPAFAGYVSGHSSYSRAAAEVLTLLTGSAFFPGGMGSFTFPGGDYLEFEFGPSADVTLEWATYYDAADQAGLSRIYGGIHIEADDLAGRRLGSRIGFDAFRKAQSLRFDATAQPRMVNFSARARTGTGSDTMIIGLVTAAQAETLVRGVGPSLVDYGVSSAEADPIITLFAAGQTEPLSSNRHWTATAGAAAAARRRGAFALNPAAPDAALLSSLPAGGYIFTNQGADPRRQGVALAEVYNDELFHLSARFRVGRDEAVAITGFVLSGERPTSVLVRGIGPGLIPFGVADALTDPHLALQRQLPGGGTRIIATNQYWQEDPQASLGIVAADVVGAFMLAEGTADTALLRVLEPGVYSVVLEGTGEAGGIALVEVYLVDRT